MGKLDIVGQKLKGKTQQLKGEIEEATGQHVKGKIDKLKGSTNNAIADIRMKVENSK